ncbi:hypothetical protein [Nocardia aurantia]|uniref:Uncharacterized protein n=1 Tax=Nocardia aurantia TaxID=2585199 RepID=A0A7K0DW23_9NOCA|nr:hypothetical protein [Nocardia aurantia]MQY29707.1 hypothetical protein [Nocardia aurantia]
MNPRAIDAVIAADAGIRAETVIAVIGDAEWDVEAGVSAGRAFRSPPW